MFLCRVQLRDNEKKIRTAFPRSLKSIALEAKLPIVYENSRLFCVRVKKEEGRGGKKEAAALFLTVPGRFQFFAIPLGDPVQEKRQIRDLEERSEVHRKRINTKKKRRRKFAKRRQNYGSRPCVVHFYSTIDYFFFSCPFFEEGKFYASRHALSPLLLLLLFFLSCFPRCILQNIDFRRLAFRSGTSSPRLAPERGDKPEKRIAPV